ncbi:hypothetical protein P879_07361 [Paragonimus westermani]|uniref:DUF4455 domain-containing protein n=1 Tax=Paragonimus westermani TaxID=34504 RepID=A0A8T0D390_9TREM|nr:hypothetical protein P879_07361 [Paragonimus westermani]
MEFLITGDGRLLLVLSTEIFGFPFKTSVFQYPLYLVHQVKQSSRKRDVGKPISSNSEILELPDLLCLPGISPNQSEVLTISSVKDSGTRPPEIDNILDRVTSKRRTKHNMCLDEWCNNLSLVSEEIERKVTDRCKATTAFLKASWEAQNNTVDSFAVLQNHHTVASKDIIHSWSNIEAESEKRKNSIDQLECDLIVCEKERIEKVS